jgi:hypothetical protein
MLSRDFTVVLGFKLLQAAVSCFMMEFLVSDIVFVWVSSTSLLASVFGCAGRTKCTFSGLMPSLKHD